MDTSRPWDADVLVMPLCCTLLLVMLCAQGRCKIAQ